MKNGFSDSADVRQLKKKTLCLLLNVLIRCHICPRENMLIKGWGYSSLKSITRLHELISWAQGKFSAAMQVLAFYLLSGPDQINLTVF